MVYCGKCGLPPEYCEFAGKQFDIDAKGLSKTDMILKIIEAQAVNNQPIPESNIGNKMLKSMGWSPGTCLGSSNSDKNLLNPIQTVKRPNRVGLGYGLLSDRK